MQMYAKHPTPYTGIAGVIERSRIRAVLELAEVGPADPVLEIGCEAGNLLVQIPDARRIVKVDISEVAPADARRLLQQQGRVAEFLQLDAQQSLPFSPGECDVIICSEMIEHVGNPGAVFENIHGISTPDTRIVVSAPIEAPKLLLKGITRDRAAEASLSQY